MERRRRSARARQPTSAPPHMSAFVASPLAGALSAPNAQSRRENVAARRAQSACGAQRRSAVRCVAQEASHADVHADAVRRRLELLNSAHPLYPTHSPISESAMMSERSSRWESLPAMWRDLASVFGRNVALVDEHHGQKLSFTFLEAYELIGTFSAAIRRLGVSPGNIVFLVSESSARDVIADNGVMSAGAACARRGPNAPLDELKYIYENSNSVGLIAESPKALRDVLSRLSPEKVKFGIVLWGQVPDELRGSGFNLLSFADVIALGHRSLANLHRPMAKRGDTAVLLYTSGTTGRPKGVPLTHDNLLYQVTYVGIADSDPRPADVFLSVLPVWHVFEKTAQNFFLSRGATVVFSGTATFRRDLARHKPHYLVGVPRVFDLIYNSVFVKLDSASRARRALFYFFYAISRYYLRADRARRGLVLAREPTPSWRRLLYGLLTALLWPLHLLAKRLVWSKVKEGVSSRHRASICGGGALASHLEDFFEVADVVIFVGYGLTETSPVVANRVSTHNVRGSAGLPPCGTHFKIVDADSGAALPPGEKGLITVRGPQVLSHYYQNEGATQAAFDSEGYFSTGDIGWLSHEGDLVISGRFKDTIVLSNGENIEPEIIETALVESPAIEQAMLVGQDERFLAALIVPSLEHLAENGWIDLNHVNSLLERQDMQALRALERELEAKKEVKELYEGEISNRVTRRAGYRPDERVRRWRLVLEGFRVKYGTLTETLKIKRNVVQERYSREIVALFAP